MSEHTQVDQVEALIARLQNGDDEARAELINVACDRLMNLTRKVKRGFGKNVQRWEETADVFQRATLRLYKSLEKVTPNDSRHFFRLAALQIRRELIDLTRHYGGPEGMGGNHATQMVGTGDKPVPHGAYDAAEKTSGPDQLNQWSEFHQAIEELPDEQREVTELLFYHELEQGQAAELMGVSVRTIKRYWRDAKVALYEKFDGQLPGAM